MACYLSLQIKWLLPAFAGLKYHSTKLFFDKQTVQKHINTENA